MILDKPTKKILMSALRHVEGDPTISLLAESLKMTKVGVWKTLKKLESENMIILNQLGNKKNSTYTIKINWNNPLIERTMTLALEQEASEQRRWLVNFADLKDSTDFLILYGSVINSYQKAKDIDIINVISKRGGFIELDEKIRNIQKLQLKKIHAVNFSVDELKREIKKPNIAFINAIKGGIVLYGQDKFVKFVRELKDGY
ncbi:MAG: hypothetical protein AABX73_01310 [Nanoarchaeota archaeon]